MRIPDRDSVYGFVTRVTPFWVHVFYKKHFEGSKHAGEPGHGPYPTFYERSMSRDALRSFGEKSGLVVKEEYGTNYRLVHPALQPLIAFIQFALHVLSFGTLARSHRNLLMILEKIGSGRFESVATSAQNAF